MRRSRSFRVRRSPGGLWLVERRRPSHRFTPQPRGLDGRLWQCLWVAETHAEAMYQAQRAAVQAWGRVLNR